MTTYTVAAGTVCHVRKVGGDTWRPFTTTRTSRFNSRTIANNGGWWVFTMNGWELRILPQLVKVTHRQQGNSVCRDCNTRSNTPRYRFYKANRPRCFHCGGTLDYCGRLEKFRTL